MVRNLRAAVEFEQDASGALVPNVGSPQDVTAPGELPALVGIHRSRGGARRASSG